MGLRIFIIILNGCEPHETLLIFFTELKIFNCSTAWMQYLVQQLQKPVLKDALHWW